MAELPIKALVFIVILVIILALLIIWHFRGFDILSGAFETGKNLTPGV